MATCIRKRHIVKAIYISGLNFAGAPERFLWLGEAGAIQLAISDDIMSEVGKTLRGKKFAWPEPEIEKTFRQLSRFAERVQPTQSATSYGGVVNEMKRYTHTGRHTSGSGKFPSGAVGHLATQFRNFLRVHFSHERALDDEFRGDFSVKRQ